MNKVKLSVSLLMLGACITGSGLLALNNIFKAYKKTAKNRRATEMTLFNEALENLTGIQAAVED